MARVASCLVFVFRRRPIVVVVVGRGTPGTHTMTEKFAFASQKRHQVGAQEDI
jgi:hypothetical protein